MLEIDQTLISFEVLRKQFCCDLKACKGACCVYGDSGAPLTVDETGLLDDHLDDLRPYMRQEGLEAVLEQGLYVTDTDGELVTPLVNGGECAYVVFEDGVALCAIEKAWQDKAIPFRKPVSCHLYPIRIKSYRQYDAVNYDQWDICQPALTLGEKDNVSLHMFLKDALVRKYGEDWFEQLDYAVKHLDIPPEEDGRV
ncbi:MAG: DUF3109 family protein [Bacteroidales bacterium]|jgi:hypothetical protein|nr:DUF3109 family protein [Bacteroidales bacterium]MDD2813124.1 DUF3109 family protein [Bacteroidales bacterium]MDD3384572.1 DUF3109 family protein [Bacteroidales bacterium]